MAWATLNGDGVVDARVELPRVGAWVADLAIDTPSPPPDGSSVTLDLNGFQLQGTVRRGGSVADTSILRVVGGAGGLARELDPLAYQGVPLQVPLRDVLGAAGEVLDVASDRGLLQTSLAFWMRARGRAGAALALIIAQVAGAVWRVQPGGQVWAGPETWPSSALLEANAELLREDPSNGREVFFADTPSLLPGTTFRGRRVSAVEHLISSDSLRMVAWYE